MSNKVSEHAQALTRSLDENIEKLTSWLGENSLAESAPQQSDESAYERLAWHYGYLIALRDVRELLAAA